METDTIFWDSLLFHLNEGGAANNDTGDAPKLYNPECEPLRLGNNKAYYSNPKHYLDFFADRLRQFSKKQFNLLANFKGNVIGNVCVKKGKH